MVGGICVAVSPSGLVEGDCFAICYGCHDLGRKRGNDVVVAFLPCEGPYTQGKDVMSVAMMIAFSFLFLFSSWCLKPFIHCCLP